MKYILPRVIRGNRGDLASRWGVIRTLEKMGVDDVVIFCRDEEDLPESSYKTVRYGKIKNAVPNLEGLRAILKADINLWAVGLDLQDDSSLLKLIYLFFLFSLYKVLKTKTIVLCQGAGPINTRFGRYISQKILKKVDIFVARDPGTFDLIHELAPVLEKYLAHDAIFLPGFDEYVHSIGETRQRLGVESGDQLLMGVNIRQWFHFSSSIIPYQFRKGFYQERSKPEMDKLVERYCDIIRWVMDKYGARVLLISAYQPGIEPWEDDLPYLKQIKNEFPDQSQVTLMEKTLDMEKYYRIMSALDLMVGMRLHSSLIAIRLGVPSLNISYTLKGTDIMEHLGLAENVISLEGLMNSPELLQRKIENVLMDTTNEREKITHSVDQAVAQNIVVLKKVLGKEHLSW